MGLIKRIAKFPTRILSDKGYVFLDYIRNLHSIPNLKQPKNFNEKLQYIKLYDHNPKYTKMVDKLAMREIIKEKIGEGYTVPVLGIWNSFEEIDFNTLPDRFVLKCNHDSGSYIICPNKELLDLDKAKKKFSIALKHNYYYQNREWIYKDIKPQVFAEQFLKDNETDFLWDYKFFCFHGKPRIMYVEQEASDNKTAAFFDMDKNFLDLEMDDPRPSVPPELPDCFDRMKDISAVLSEGIPFLRVDFFVINGKIYVGEMTFFHDGGFGKIRQKEWNLRMGSWIDLSGIQKQ